MVTKRVFNINDYVWVKLTDKGRQIFKDHYKGFPSGLQLPQIKEDADGYSEWQLWYLMQIFGEHIAMGCPSPFLMEVLFDEKNLKVPGQQDSISKTKIVKRRINWR